MLAGGAVLLACALACAPESAATVAPSVAAPVVPGEPQVDAPVAPTDPDVDARAPARATASAPEAPGPVVSVVSPLSTAAAAPATPATGLPATIAGNHGSRTSFVRKPQVRESDLTRGILDAIWPYYDRRDIVIGGYLSPDEQVWKVNYHWELALWVCDRALNLALPPAQKARFATIGERLRAHAPVPASGYLNDPEPGLTRDSTGVAAQTERYRVLDAAKDELAALIRESGARQKVDGATRARFVLAVQNVLPPGSVNKHGRGYSLDIKGDNARIVRVSRSLGATETYVEEHHVHVEFANGVTLPGAP